MRREEKMIGEERSVMDYCDFTVLSGFCVFLIRMGRDGSHRNKERFNKVCKILMS